MLLRGDPQMSEAECRAYDAPFTSLATGLRHSFSGKVPETREDDGLLESRQAEPCSGRKSGGPSVSGWIRTSRAFMEQLRQGIAAAAAVPDR